MERHKLAEPVKMMIGSVVAILVAFWFWQSLVENPLHELALIRRAQLADGALVDSFESEQEDSRGHVYSFDVGVYAYRVPDGREFKTTTRVPTGKLKERQEVEYLPDNPAVSRMRGDGCHSIMEWLWRKVALGLLLLVLFLSPGVVLLRHAIRAMKKLRTDKPLSSCERNA